MQDTRNSDEIIKKLKAQESEAKFELKKLYDENETFTSENGQLTKEIEQLKK